MLRNAVSQHFMPAEEAVAVIRVVLGRERDDRPAQRAAVHEAVDDPLVGTVVRGQATRADRLEHDTAEGRRVQGNRDKDA